MRNHTAHFRPYHFQHFSYFLGRLGRRIRYNTTGQMHGWTQQGKCNSKDQKGRSNPRDRRHLQTACFETPIYMDFFALKIRTWYQNVQYIPDFLDPRQHLRKTHSLGPRPHVSGYFWIRNFFFPDTKKSASTRYVITVYSCRIRPSTRIRIHSGFTEDWQNCPTRHWFVQV